MCLSLACSWLVILVSAAETTNEVWIIMVHNSVVFTKCSYAHNKYSPTRKCFVCGELRHRVCSGCVGRDLWSWYTRVWIFFCVSVIQPKSFLHIVSGYHVYPSKHLWHVMAEFFYFTIDGPDTEQSAEAADSWNTGVVWECATSKERSPVFKPTFIIEKQPFRKQGIQIQVPTENKTPLVLKHRIGGLEATVSFVLF